MSLHILPLTDVAALREAGIGYPSTEHSWRWLYRNRIDRGLELAFIRVGRRVLVDVPRFLELARCANFDVQRNAIQRHSI
jgi:hypothetical protein